MIEDNEIVSNFTAALHKTDDDQSVSITKYASKHATDTGDGKDDNIYSSTITGVSPTATLRISSMKDVGHRSDSKLLISSVGIDPSMELTPAHVKHFIEQLQYFVDHGRVRDQELFFSCFEHGTMIGNVPFRNITKGDSVDIFECIIPMASMHRIHNITEISSSVFEMLIGIEGQYSGGCTYMTNTVIRDEFGWPIEALVAVRYFDTFYLGTIRKG